MFIVTTAREDVNIQQYVRRRAGKFPVEIYYGSVIKNFLLENQTIKDKYYPIINNTVETNVWDYIRYRAKEKNEDLYVKIFLDDLGIIYEGSLRYHESEPEKEQTLCLSGYRRYKKNEYGKYEVTHDYADDTSRLVLVKINDIKRVEIKYDSNK